MRGGMFTESFRAAARLDLGKLHFLVPLRLTAGTIIPLIIGLATDHASLGVSAAIGSFMLGMADTGDVFPVRARVFGVTAVGLIVSQFVGAKLSESLLMVAAAAIPLAFLCGYAGAIGPRAANVGVIVLVNYCISGGVAVDGARAIDSTLAVVAGCILQAALALSGWPLKRCAGMRGQVADAYRTMSLVCKSDPADMLAPAVGAQVVAAIDGITTSGVTGQTREWIAGLAEDCEGLRLGMTSLAIHRQTLAEHPERTDEVERRALQEFCESVSVCSRIVARALVVQRRKAKMPEAVRAAHLAGQAAAVHTPHLVEVILSALDSAAARIAQPFPIGKSAASEPPNIPVAPWGVHVKSHWRSSSIIMRHAIRMAVLYPAGWLVGFAAIDHHQYWVPLTIAWVARPGFALTFGRATSRTLGTLGGLGVAGALIYGLSPNNAWLTVICFAASLILFAALPVNYAIAVIFITTLIVGMLEISNDPLVDSLVDRGSATVIAGVMCLIAVRVAPIYASAGVASQLATMVGRIRVLANAALQDRDQVWPASQSVLNARIAATAAIESAKIEPKQAGMDPRIAQRTVNMLLATIFALIAAEPEGRRRTATVQVADINGAALDQDLHALENKLQRIAGEDAPALEPVTDPPPDDAARAPVARAWHLLADVPTSHP